MPGGAKFIAPATGKRVKNEPFMFQGSTQNHEIAMVAAGFSVRRTGETLVPPGALSQHDKP
jgi:hypothetical protein